MVEITEKFDLPFSVSDDDFYNILEMCNSSSYSSSSSLSPHEDDCFDQQDQVPQIFNLEEERIILEEGHCFRHAAEVNNETHGGYLKGKLPIPKPLLHKDFDLEIVTIPGIESMQEYHPNMIHVTELDERGKSRYKTKLTQRSWCLHLRKCGNKIFVIEPDGNQIEIKKCISPDDKFILLGSTGLKLTIITPLQRASRGKGYTIAQVFQDRVFNLTDLNIDDMVANYVNRKINHNAKRELHVVRLSTTFTDFITYDKYKILSDNINNHRNKEVGRFGITTISHGRTCAKGLRGCLLVSEAKLPSIKNTITTYPVFVMKDLKTNKLQKVEDFISPPFNQIDKSSIEIIQNIILNFSVPPQSSETIAQLKSLSPNYQLHLGLSRAGKFSNKTVPFNYDSHDEDECCYCIVFSKNDKTCPIEDSRLRKKPRNSDSNFEFTFSPDSGIDMSPYNGSLNESDYEMIKSMIGDDVNFDGTMIEDAKNVKGLTELTIPIIDNSENLITTDGELSNQFKNMSLGISELIIPDLTQETLSDCDYVADESSESYVEDELPDEISMQNIRRNKRNYSISELKISPPPTAGAATVSDDSDYHEISSKRYNKDNTEDDITIKSIPTNETINSNEFKWIFFSFIVLIISLIYHTFL